MLYCLKIKNRQNNRNIYKKTFIKLGHKLYKWIIFFINFAFDYKTKWAQIMICQTSNESNMLLL